MAIRGRDNLIVWMADHVLLQSAIHGRSSWRLCSDVSAHEHRPGMWGYSYGAGAERVCAATAVAAVRNGWIEPYGAVGEHYFSWALTEMGRARARVILAEAGEPIPPQIALADPPAG